MPASRSKRVAGQVTQLLRGARRASGDRRRCTPGRGQLGAAERKSKLGPEKIEERKEEPGKEQCEANWPEPVPRKMRGGKKALTDSVGIWTWGPRRGLQPERTPFETQCSRSHRSAFLTEKRKGFVLDETQTSTNS